LFAEINGWTPTNFFWRRHTLFFIAKNTLVFTLIVQRVFSFSRTAFSFHFSPWFFSDLVISLYQGAFRPLVYVVFHQKSCFKKVWMVLEKRKKFHDYSGTNGSLFRLWLRLFACHACCYFDSMLSSFYCSMTCLKWLRLLNVPLKESCVFFVIWEHVIVVFSFDALFGLTWRMLNMFDSNKSP
jgi:hypothetical protein